MLLAAGRTTVEIARELSLSVHTVRNHIGRILKKTHSANRLEAVSAALRDGIIPPPR
jgi:two-component system NarL family response regulator